MFFKRLAGLAIKLRVEKRIDACCAWTSQTYWLKMPRKLGIKSELTSEVKNSDAFVESEGGIYADRKPLCCLCSCGFSARGTKFVVKTSGHFQASCRVRGGDVKFARNLFSLNFRQNFGCGSDMAQLWLGCGSDMAQLWLGCGSDMARMWLGRVFGCDRKSLAEVKGKRFPAVKLHSKVHSMFRRRSCTHNFLTILRTARLQNEAAPEML